ncbi:hypothetical protein F5Y03DRAFT_125860 [Xylaria venustula]|nr:hypothetical protein F5Y03DRAFT_125860 [Xylaria venustula]
MDSLQLIGMTSPKTREAIQGRRHSNRVSSSTWMETEDVLPIGRLAITFRGLQIRLGNERWKIEVLKDMPDDTESSNSKSDTPELEQEVLNALTQPYHIVDHDEFYVLLPSFVESGDWIVREHFYDGRCFFDGFFILRERGDNR